MSRIKYALLGLVLIGIAGCGEQTTETAEQLQQAEVEEPALQPEEPQSVPKKAPQVAKQAPAPARPAPAPPAPSQTTQQEPMDVTEAIKAAPQPSEPEPAQPVPVPQAVQQQPAPQVTQPPRITIPAGTDIQVRLQDPLNSSVDQSGDTFRTILDKDINVNGNIVASRGSILEGKLSNVSRAGRVEGRATMSLRLVSLNIGDQSYPLQTQVLAIEAESTTKEDATKVGIGAGIGAVIGAIAGGGKGAAIGAAVGGGAGGATVLATRGKEVKFEAEQVFIFKLTEDVGIK